MKQKISELMKIEESEIEEIFLDEQQVGESQETIRDEMIDFEEYEALEDAPEKSEIVEESEQIEYYDEEMNYFDVQDSEEHIELVEEAQLQQGVKELDRERTIEYDGASCYSCTICDFVFEDVDDQHDDTIQEKIQEHLNGHEEGRNYCCMICAELFSTYKDLELHQNRSHNLKDLLICPTCRKKFGSFESIESHKSNCRGKCGQYKKSRKSFQCYICNGKLNEKIITSSNKVDNNFY